MKFTEDQQRVIDSRNKNVLVAAAAGSGKTAVLVSRIIGRVLDKKDPIDIDRILVVTFTNAAAAEMKERIRNALEDELEKNPQDEHLNRQMNLIHTAHIMTIDSFCRMVILDNFDRIGIEPQVRIADESELAIMREDAVADTLEKFYEESSEEFLHFLEEFSTRKDDSDLVETVLELYNFSQSKADPDKWIRELEDSYRCEDLEGLFQMPWMKLLERIVSEEIKECINELERTLDICGSDSGPWIYEQNLNEDIDLIKDLSQIKEYDELRTALNVKFGRLSTKKAPDVDPSLRERVKAIRDSVKKNIESLRKNYFRESAGEILESVKKARPLVKELSEITRSFTERFGEIKEDKNVIDFNDLEHIALNILKTGAGDSYRDYFAEVMTDEYQDSNSVQEEILTSVAGDDNYFCVGDVKQSIYSFRLADPSIFMHRYLFSEKDEKSERILLSKNFRSRKEVLDSVNAVFRVIMHEDIGEVEYDDDAALYCGAAYGENEGDHKTEFIIAAADEDDEIDSIELEAKITAERIKSMVGNFPVESLKDGSVRKAEFSDFAILLRSLKGADEIYEKALEEAGIPAFMESRSGYFQTEEIRTMISLLTVINNPMNDIALAAVMLSPIGAFNDEEMSEIRSTDIKGSFFNALMTAAGRKVNEESNIRVSEKLSLKINDFLEMIESYRKISNYTPIHKLIEKILDESGYEYYAMAKGGSASRNLNLLIKKAEDFEKTSYKGIFFFLRYIEKLKKYEMDFGEAKGVNEGMNAVRIMSIHKSKGLEFPIVFIGRLSKKFNMRDIQGKTVHDSEYGIGMERTDAESRIRYTLTSKNVIAEKKRRDVIGEELRIFYVAMTRAKEKLIMTAVCDDPEKTLENPAKSVSHSASYMDFMLKALEYDPVKKDINVEIKRIPEIVYDDLEEDVRLRTKREFYENILSAGSVDEKTNELLTNNLKWTYPFEKAFILPAKLSVSGIKKQMMEEEDINVYIKDEIDETEETEETEEMPQEDKDRDAKKSEKVRAENAASRGTAYHKAFELMIEKDISSLEDSKNYLAGLAEDGYLTDEVAAMINPYDIYFFARSELKKRMSEAEKAGRLFREQPFIIAKAAADINDEWPEDETVQIQGIIDAFFIEDDKIYLVDYKTDRGVSEETLVERYRIQLDIYAESLKKITGLEIGDEIIYSVFLKKSVSLI